MENDTTPTIIKRPYHAVLLVCILMAIAYVLGGVFLVPVDTSRARCSDFKTQTEAMKNYAIQLDGDYDGEPCEHLPKT